jgi:hypothetical protein
VGIRGKTRNKAGELRLLADRIPEARLMTSRKALGTRPEHERLWPDRPGNALIAHRRKRQRSELEDDTGRDRAGQDVVDGLVDLVDLAVDSDHLGAAGGVQGEDVGEVVTGAND